MFLDGVHFAEGLKASLRHEHGVIAKAMRAAWRPDPNALRLAYKAFLMPIGSGKHQGTDGLLHRRQDFRAPNTYSEHPLPDDLGVPELRGEMFAASVADAGRGRLGSRFT